LAATDIPVIASGGVGVVDDLATLAGVETGGRRLAGAIVGRALYEQRFTVTQALGTIGRALDRSGHEASVAQATDSDRSV
jgi:phosphoribosylformimino-5-aminoimidazole carboxamide ribonucleotide (ProFAR) isomerase